MTRWVVDTESDGFVDQLTRIHILVLKDPDNSIRHVFRNNGKEDTIRDGLKLMLEADQIIGHNLIGHDCPALAKVYDFEIEPQKVRDTLVLSKLYFGAIKEADFIAAERHGFPKHMIGRHSIEAWGHRLHTAKVGTDITDWSVWTQHMEDRCVSDVSVNVKLLKHIEQQTPWPIAEELEHQAAFLCAQIERNQCPFDTDAAIALYAELAQVREGLANQMKSLFPSWVVYQGEVVSKANNSKHGHTIGAVYSKIKINEFNPLSRDHIADRLKVKYGWKPTEFTDKGKPKIDEKVLHSLEYPEAQQLAELFLIEKRIGQVAEGKEAWLKNQRDGWVKHHINPNGAVTGRATHSGFNISQVPKVGSRYGKQCRELFGLHEKPLKQAGLWERWKNGKQVGTDASGLELRCLAHFMAIWDKGEYGKAVVEGSEEDGTDVHSVNTRAIGFDPQRTYTISGKTKKGRDAGKTWIYMYLYGGGDEKAGNTVGVSEQEIEPLIASHSKLAASARKRIKREGRKLTPRLVATFIKGVLMKAKFLKGLPALSKLKEKVEAATTKGHLIGLDGRHVHIRSPHAALNTLLQSAGALVCKKWIVETEKELLKAGYKHGWDGDFVFLMWIHDELQIACLNDAVKEAVKEAAKAAMKTTERFFKFRIPLDCGAKTGMNWASTH